LEESDGPRLGVIDWLMPQLDGPDLCRRIRAKTDGAYRYIILLTSRDRHEDIVAGLEAGADDYLTKPFDRNELQARVRVGDRILDLETRLLKSLADVKLGEQHVAEFHKREADLAARIQQLLLLGHAPAGPFGECIAALTIPSQKIDGDFYDFLMQGDGAVDVIVGDVMGKGVPAALMGAAIKNQIVRAINQLQAVSANHQIPTPQQIVARVHDEVADEFISLERFATLCYARFNFADEELTWVDCGHTKTLHLPSGSAVCHELEGGDNMPLGFSIDETYLQVSVPFHSGDLFLFYSDGITEAQSPSGEFYGVDRLMRFVESGKWNGPEQLVKAVHDSVVSFAESNLFSDDLTCVAVIVGPKASTRVVARSSMLGKSNLGDLRAIRRFVYNFCTALEPQLPDDGMNNILLAVTEAAVNIMRHAYSGVSNQPIWINAQARAGSISIELRHQGKEFDPNTAPPPAFNGSRDGGFGVYIISKCVDRVHYRNNGPSDNSIELILNR
jgi:sigma-B regulation protein RsbU (phosphoserine phosphatase)